MSNKKWFILAGLVVAAVVIYAFLEGSRGFVDQRDVVGVDSEEMTLEEEAASIDAMTEAPVKEFTITSFFEMVDGNPAPQFSLKEIVVNKGDKVRIKVTNTKGTHDFTLNEYNIFEETPLDQEVVIEFTADKAGEFFYYCSKPNHRALGQWGTLKVLEN